MVLVGIDCFSKNWLIWRKAHKRVLSSYMVSNAYTIAPYAYQVKNEPGMRKFPTQYFKKSSIFIPVSGCADVDFLYLLGAVSILWFYQSNTWKSRYQCKFLSRKHSMPVYPGSLSTWNTVRFACRLLNTPHSVMSVVVYPCMLPFSCYIICFSWQHASYFQIFVRTNYIRSARAYLHDIHREEWFAYFQSNCRTIVWLRYGMPTSR